MTFMNGDQKLLSTDERGRVRVPPERREALLDEFERSGMSGAKFARMAGVQYPTFAVWVSKRRVRADHVTERPVAFMEAVVEGGSGMVV